MKSENERLTKITKQRHGHIKSKKAILKDLIFTDAQRQRFEEYWYSDRSLFTYNILACEKGKEKSRKLT